MKTVRIKIEPNTLSTKRVGRVNTAKLDATTETQIAQHAAEDNAAAMQDAAEFATRIYVSLETIRNWEQGKRSPTGAAKALLKVLDKAPEAALAALH